MDGITFDQLQEALNGSVPDLNSSFERIINLQSLQTDTLKNVQQLIGQKVEAIVDYQRTTTSKLSEMIKFLNNSTADKPTTTKQIRKTEAEKEPSKTKESNNLNDIKLVSSASKDVPTGLKVLPVRLTGPTEQKTQIVHDSVAASLLTTIAKSLDQPKEDESQQAEKQKDTNAQVEAKKEKKKETAKEPVNLFSSLFSVFKNNKEENDLPTEPISPYHKESLEIVIPPETEVKLQNIIGDTLKPFFDRQHEDNNDLIDGVAKGNHPKEKEKPKGFLETIGEFFKYLLPVIAGVGATVGGIMALFSGLMDDGPFKGLKKLLGDSALTVGFKALTKVSGKGLLKGITGSFFKKIPLIGSLISLGFAYSRFQNGDTVGGVIDVLNALTGILFLTPAAPLAIPISLALDALNAFLDYKAGETKGKERTTKKLDILKDMGGWIYDKLKSVPVIGPLMKAGKSIFDGDWDTGFKYLGEAIAPLQQIGSIILQGVKTYAPPVLTAVGDWTATARKWLYDKAKEIPVIGPLIKAGESIFNGDWETGFNYLGNAIEPLQYIGGMLLEKAKETAPVAGDWLMTAGKWLYGKAREIPVIGPLIKAGESIGDGRWLDAFGYLGEALEPLRVIGDLLIGGTKAVAVTATNNIADFWSTMKDSLLRAVLDMVPDIKIGKWSLKQKVADILGIDVAASASVSTETRPPGTPITINDKQEKPEAKPDVLGKTKAAISSKDSATRDTSNTTDASNQGSVNESVRSSEDQGKTISLSSIKPVSEQKLTPEAQSYMEGNKFDQEALIKAFQSQTEYVKAQLGLQKNTADNTKELIKAFRAFKENTGKSVTVNNVSSPTTFMSNPVTSMMFRESLLSR
ncbi:hypothetical protein UFOVP760_143 [uncultured Caudovirales phage]|uniref:Uncharacterized protein n=1 Tax=uncultured Caudovirales phage TaxID=2100421 RepID=A0A6J7X9E1_9CAUD|nr:hypothetical protein UFOVP760_143 [uncultured Caudovirales phage]